MDSHLRAESGSGPLADYSVGMRVQTREGYPGVINDILEGPGDLTTYWVTLDGGMGGGEYAEAEIWPLAAQQTASQMAAEAGVERTAADDYPILENILADRLPPQITTTANRLGEVAQAAQDFADGLPRCGSCGQAYYASPDPEHQDNFGNDGHRHAAYEGTEVKGTCKICGKKIVLKRGSLVHADGSNEHAVVPSDDSNAPIGVTSDLALRLALYLPPKPESEQRASTTPISENQKQGYDEGFAHGKEGITRQPSAPADSDYMVGYEIGWSEGVLVNRTPPDASIDNDLEKAQIAGTYPDPLGPMRASLSPIEYLEQMESRGAPLDLGMPKVASQAEAGAFKDFIQGNPNGNKYWDGIGKTWSYDWCRFRRNSHCWLSKTLDEPATKAAGYAVWVPEDRGFCPRIKWDDQIKCPVGAPGEHVPGGLLDATVPYSQGGQHGGVPSGQYRNDTKAEASLDAEAGAEGDLPSGLTYQAWYRTDPTNDERLPDGTAIATCNWGVDVVAALRWNYYTEPPEVIGITVEPQYRRRGIGTALFNWVKETQQSDLRHSDLLTDDGKGFTQSFSSLSDRLASLIVEATWREVQQKAKRIRSQGGVRIVAAQNDEVVAHVQGDHGIYETHLRRNPGRKNVAYWHCGCKWGHYAWGRSPAYKRFEGRMCSHALALQYEAQARTIFDRPMTLDEKQPAWMDQKHVHLPGDYRRDLKRYTSLVAEAIAGTAAFYARVRGVIRTVLLDEQGPKIDGQHLVPVSEVLAPNWHPTKGLNIHDNSRLAKSMPSDTAFAQAVHDRLAEARRVEPGITSMLQNIASKEGGLMAGLEFRFKTEGSLLRKVKSEAHEYGDDPVKTVKNMSDVLRYTILFVPEGYAEETKEALEEIQSHGYQLRTKNYWGRGDPYNGINVAITSPSGWPFELQFHTPDSFFAKEREVHALYEKWRLKNTPEAERKMLSAEMRDLSDAVHRPPGALGIGTLKDQGIPGWVPGYHLRTSMSDHFQYLLLFNHAHDEAIGLIKSDGSDVEIWRDGQWVSDPEFGRYYFKGEPRSEPITAAEAEAWMAAHRTAALGSTTAAEYGPIKQENMRRCYELAAKRVTLGPNGNMLSGYKGSTLIQGTIQGFGMPPIGHAWVIEPDGKVWEPATDTIYSKDDFEDLYSPRVMETYSVDETRRQVGKSHHWGPWSEQMMATAAKDPKPPEVSGLVLKAADTGRILMLQRDMTDNKDPAAGTWEFPGGHHEDGDLTSLHAAIREWQEEVGQEFPAGGFVAHTWTSPNGIYQGHVVVIPKEKDLVLHEGRVMENPDDPDSKCCEQVAWWTVEHAKKNPALREECKASPWKEIEAATATQKVASLIKTADEDQCPRCGEDSCPNAVRHDGVMRDVYDCPSCGARFLDREVLAEVGPFPHPADTFADLPEVSYDHSQFPSFVPAHGGKQATGDEWTHWDDPQAHEDMEGDDYVDQPADEEESPTKEAAGHGRS
jgi:8-oxo-dGTP pyrophosphatase MutT (NUDIX family)/GNAT superfamily N-acetyltransferase